MRQEVHLLHIHLELLDVVLYHRGQFVVREKWFLDQTLQYVECLRQVFVERIEGDEGML